MKVPSKNKLALMLLTLHTTINSSSINKVTPKATSLTKSWNKSILYET